MPKTIKQDKLRIDEDGVSKEWLMSTKEFSDFDQSVRMRFQAVISNRLNTRRAIREMVLPELAELRKEIQTLRGQVQRIEQLLS